jgi:DNA-directed RNA polymerase subunit M
VDRKMEFCPKCGMRLAPEKMKKSNKLVLKCPKCGYVKPTASKKIPATKAIEKTGANEKITIIGKEEAKLRTLPTHKVQCPKCNNREAYWWMVQTRGADESTTQFFRCTKCGHTWREMA